MATRLRAKKATENAEPMKMMDGKLLAPRPAVGEAKDKRTAFGDIRNRLESGIAASNADKLKSGYKDVKPRVDTRWRKEESTASSKTSTTSSSAPLSSMPVPKPFFGQKQISKPKLVMVTESVTSYYKSTKVSLMDVKKQPAVRKDSKGDLLIKSPGVKFPSKTTKVGNVQKNFYESHSSKLLQQVENIDENDGANPQLLSEYVNDIYMYLFKVEKMFPIRENFLTVQMDVTPKMRSVLLDWINEVHNQFSLELETYHLAVSMIDRYLQAKTSTPRRYLQLVGVTCLFTASKYEELMPPEISDFVYVTDDTYSKEQILQMEKTIFSALSFNLAKPLPIHFLRRFAKAAGTLGDRQYMAAKYFIEAATIDYEMTKYKPSEVAAASLYLSLYVLNTLKSNDDLWNDTLKYYSTYSVKELMPIVKRLAVIIASAKEVKLKSVFTKYSHAAYKFIATLPEMSGTKMYEIINRE